MNITPTHRRITLLVLVALGAFGTGGVVRDLATQPEVEIVTVSEEVPSSCADAARTAAAGFKAWENLDQYETKAEVLASDLTLSLLTGDAAKIEESLTPIAEHNAKEAEWRVKRNDARDSFEDSATECLAKAAAVEAARGR